MANWDPDVHGRGVRQSQFKAKISEDVLRETEELASRAESFDDITEKWVVRALLDIYKNATRPTVQYQALTAIMNAKGLTGASPKKKSDDGLEETLKALGITPPGAPR